MFIFCIDLCVHQNVCHEYYYFASLGILTHQGCRTQRLTKSLRIFLYGQEIIKKFVLEHNQWKYWMSFIACGRRFSRSYTVYSWLSKGWLLGIWAYQTMQYDFPEWPPNNSLLLLNSQCPKQPLLNQLYTCVVYV